MSRIDTLRDQIIKAKHAYYYSNKPLMPDEVYDALEDELALLSPSDPVLAMVGSPVPADSILTAARHSIPMGSQNKLNSATEFKSWYAKNETSVIHCSLKGDGGSAGGYYRDGYLMQAISRGDGFEGEDITANALRFKGLPAYVGVGDGRGFTGAVRFEVILTVSDWGKADPSLATNPRNLGNGIMRRKSGEQSDLLTIFAFDISEEVNGVFVEWDTETQKTERLAELGFNVIENKTFASADDAVSYFDDVASRRSALPIWIDGVVLKIDSIARQNELGVSGGCPRAQVAWKFDAAGAETVLESVVISGGHTGSLVPTAQFRPVTIGGTTITSASLANFDEIERLGIAIGDHLLIQKRNDIIPKVSLVIHRPESRTPIAIPTSCPFCGGEVGRKQNSGGDDGVVLVCKNPDCSKKSTGKIGRWISSLEILGVGDGLLEALIDRFDLEDAADLYTLHERQDDLAQLVINVDRDLRFGQKRATSLLDEIERKRTLSLAQFLGSLGLDYLGKRRVELMMTAAQGDLSKLGDWQSGRLRDLSFAAKVGVPGIGTQIQNGIDAMDALIGKLLRNGVVIRETEVAQQKADLALKGTVCISGALPSGKKKAEFTAPLERAGFKLVDDVSKDLTYLVLADPNSNSGKCQKARKLNIKVISETELNGLLDGSFAQEPASTKPEIEQIDLF